jgi:hypothetical protein
MTDALHEGNLRMEAIEGDIRELSQDLKPLMKLYHAVVGASVLVVMLVSLVVFIYQGDRESNKALTDAVYKQGIVIEKLIASHQELEKDTTKEFQRMEKAMERLHIK